MHVTNSTIYSTAIPIIPQSDHILVNPRNIWLQEFQNVEMLPVVVFAFIVEIAISPTLVWYSSLIFDNAHGKCSHWLEGNSLQWREHFFEVDMGTSQVQCVFLPWNLILQVFLPAHQGAQQGPVVMADEKGWVVRVGSKSTLGFTNLHGEVRGRGRDVFSLQVNWNLILPQFVFTKCRWSWRFFVVVVVECAGLAWSNRIQTPYS